MLVIISIFFFFDAKLQSCREHKHLIGVSSISLQKHIEKVSPLIPVYVFLQPLTVDPLLKIVLVQTHSELSETDNVKDR